MYTRIPTGPLAALTVDAKLWLASDYAVATSFKHVAETAAHQSAGAL